MCQRTRPCDTLFSDMIELRAVFMYQLISKGTEMTLLTSLMQWILLSSLTLSMPQNYSDVEAVFIGAIVGTIVIALAICLAVYIVCAIFLMKLFAKANVPAWKAWIPFVNTWKFLELGGYHGAFCLFLLGNFIPYFGWMISLVTTVFLCMAAYQIGLKNSKDGAWVVLYIFLAPVWTGIMGLGNSVWNDSLGKPALGPERPPSWPPYGNGGGYGGNAYYGNAGVYGDNTYYDNTGSYGGSTYYDDGKGYTGTVTYRSPGNPGGGTGGTN